RRSLSSGPARLRLLFHADHVPGQSAPFLIFSPVEYGEGRGVVRRSIDGIARQALARIGLLPSVHHGRVELAHDLRGNARRPRERKPNFGDERRKALLRESWNTGEVGNTLARRDRECAHLST